MRPWMDFANDALLLDTLITSQHNFLPYTATLASSNRATLLSMIWSYAPVSDVMAILHNDYFFESEVAHIANVFDCGPGLNDLDTVIETYWPNTTIYVQRLTYDEHFNETRTNIAVYPFHDAGGMLRIYTTRPESVPLYGLEIVCEGNSTFYTFSYDGYWGSPWPVEFLRIGLSYD